MFNRNENRMNGHMRRFEGFGMNGGPGRGPGQFGGFRKMNGKDRFFKKGNLQYVILQMLQEEPRHGYQIIKDLEGRFNGFYAPSPGSVYPILQMLEDRDFVSIQKEGNKKYILLLMKVLNFQKKILKMKTLRNEWNNLKMLILKE